MKRKSRFYVYAFMLFLYGISAPVFAGDFQSDRQLINRFKEIRKEVRKIHDEIIYHFPEWSVDELQGHCATGFEANQFFEEESQKNLTPLQSAILFGNRPLAVALICEAKADVNMCHPNKDPYLLPICLSSLLGDPELTQLLIQHGANLERFATLRYSYSFDFITDGPGEKILLEHIRESLKTQPTEYFNDADCTLESFPEFFFMAAMYRDGDFFRSHLSNTSNINTLCNFKEEGKCTLLQIACYIGKNELAMTLVEDFEADVNYVDEKTKIDTPIDIAISMGNVELVQFLLNHGAKPNALLTSDRFEGRDVLEITQKNYKSLQIIKSSLNR